MQRKWLIIGLAVILIAGSGGAWYFLGKDTGNVASARVVTTQVRAGSIEGTVSGSGSLEPADRKTIKPTETGEVAEVLFSDGDRVKAGDILITFVQDDISEELDNYELQLEKSKLELERLQTQFKKAQDGEEREEIKLEIEKKMMDIEDIEEDMAELAEEQTRDPIVAPIDGTLVNFDIEPGDTISANTSLGEVVDYDHLIVVVSVDELDISQIELGQTASITADAVLNTVYTGKVTDIAQEGSVVNGVASFDVTVQLDSNEHLRPGMSVDVTIQVARKENALLLPLEAVQSVGDRYFVLVPSDETGSDESGAPAANRRDRSAMAPPAASRFPAEQGPTSQSGETQGDAAGQGLPEGDMPQGEAPSPSTEPAQSEGEQGTGSKRPQGRGASPGSFEMNGQSVVFVEVGVMNDSFVEIVSGLSEGDTVIVPQVADDESEQTFPGDGFRGGMPGGGFGGGIPGGGGMPGGGFGGIRGGGRP